VKFDFLACLNLLVTIPDPKWCGYVNYGAKKHSLTSSSFFLSYSSIIFCSLVYCQFRFRWYISAARSSSSNLEIVRLWELGKKVHSLSSIVFTNSSLSLILFDFSSSFFTPRVYKRRQGSKAGGIFYLTVWLPSSALMFERKFEIGLMFKLGLEPL